MKGILVQSAKAKLIADTFALVTFAFAIGMFVEVVLSRLTLEQSLQSRLFAIPLNVIIARPYGQYRDWLFMIAKAESRGRFIRIFTDILAFLTFMIPQYAIVLAWTGADVSQILIACFSVVFLSLLVGRPYGLYLILCRRLLEKISA